MPTRRVQCKNCKKTIRSRKLRSWIQPPAYELRAVEQTLTDPQTKQIRTVVTQERVCIFPGLRAARHTLCRPCYKAENGTRRPV